MRLSPSILRGVLTLIAALFFFVGQAGPPRSAGAAVPGVQGDVTCDGAVNTFDGLQSFRSAAGIAAGADCLADSGDVDCDGDVDTDDGLLTLRFVADVPASPPGGCTPIAGLLRLPTSFDLIAGALERAEIGQETALVYEFYAAFNDPRLPEIYRGNDSGVAENPALRDLPALWDSLSQETRDLLAPFLRTPPEPDSWYAQQGNMTASGIEWGTVTAASRPVKVWWETRFPEDEDRAQEIADAVDARIWPMLTDVMGGKVPLPDCGAGCPSGGGDPALDIYLVASGANIAYTQWNPPDQATCENTPAFIVMLRDSSLGTVAHEFMHALQFAFPYANGDGCDEYDWWAEATATWAEDYTYKDGQSEQSFAPLFLQTTHQPLEESSDSRKYGAYVFPFYLSRVKNLPLLIGDTFAEFETESDSVKGIDSALKSALIVKGFDDVWADFALKNWNREPVTTYRDEDGLSPGATSVSQEVRLGEVELEEAEVEHLAAVHFKFTFHPDVRNIVFKNTLTGTEHASVWAIKKVKGEWKDPEDWSDEQRKEFCFDRPSEDLTELIIIVANSDAIDKRKLEPSSPPTIEGKADGCSGWEGSVTVEGFGLGGSFDSPDTTHNGTYTATTQALRFEPLTGAPLVWELVSGTARWTVAGERYDSCGEGGTVSGELNIDFASDIGRERFSGRLFLDPFDDSIYSVYIEGDLADAMEVWSCPPPDEAASGEHPWWGEQSFIPNITQSRDQPLAEEGGMRVAQGEFTLIHYGGFEKATYRWRFVEYGEQTTAR